MLTLDQLNAGDAATFVTSLGDVFEHAAWVADAVVSKPDERASERKKKAEPLL